MTTTKRSPGILPRQRLLALSAAAFTLWAAGVTAGSKTVSAAAEAIRLRLSSPMALVRWELGDLYPQDGLSSAAAMVLGESPLLLSVRSEVAALWSRETPNSSADAPQENTEPVIETPVVTPPAAEPAPDVGAPIPDNGVPARTLVPTDPSGYTVCGRVYISNSSKRSVTPAALTEPFTAELSDDGPQILIVHTHGSEAYTPADDSGVIWSGDMRTTDSRYNVVGVGDEMARVFADAGISVIHDRSMYDYPNYSGAYDRSLASIKAYLEEYPSIRFVLDVHRDAIVDGDGNAYKVISSVDGAGNAAQLALVMGTDGGGLSHPDWMENLKLATALQEDLLTEYPTLMRPIMLRNSRYNQHTTTGSLLVEVGAAGNSPEEALLAGRLFAARMAAVLKNAQS